MIPPVPSSYVHTPIAATEANLIVGLAKSAADERYSGPFKSKKVEVAGKATELTIDFYNKMPIGWMPSDNIDKIYAAAEEHAKVGILPLLSFSTILWWICSAVVSWAVKRFLDSKFKNN